MDLPALKVLMAGYFNEDFDGLAATVDLYISHSSPDERRDLIGEIEHVLRTNTDDHDLDRVLERMGSYADLGEDPAAYRTWLEEIARRVAAA